MGPGITKRAMSLSLSRKVRPDPAVEAALAPIPPPAPMLRTMPQSARDREARLRGLVDDHIDFVARVLRNAGTPPAEIDDDVQRTFIATARRLDAARPGAEKSFILRIALNV